MEFQFKFDRATDLLEPYRHALGAPYTPSTCWQGGSGRERYQERLRPHLMTCYWTLEEVPGICERTARRHLVEADHPWSATVKHLIVLRHNYGQVLDGKDKSGLDKYKPCITSTVIRFFPKADGHVGRGKSRIRRCQAECVGLGEGQGRGDSVEAGLWQWVGGGLPGRSYTIGISQLTLATGKTCGCPAMETAWL